MALAAGCTDYNNETLSAMKRDIEKWIGYIKEDKETLLEGRTSLIQSNAWNRFDCDLTGALNDAINRCDTLKELLTIVLSEISESTVSEHALSLLKEIGEKTQLWHEELSKSAYSVERSVNCDYQSAQKLQELLFLGADLMSDMWDADNMIEPMRNRYLLDSKQSKPETKETKILLIVATKIELDSLIDELNSYCTTKPEISPSGSGLLASIGQKQLFIVKSQMGSEGAGGSILTTANAIKEFNPNFVIMCGIAWGGDSKKQKIGDLIISQKVWAYEPGKINKNGSFTPRGPINEASAKLVSMFEFCCLSEKEFEIHYGLIASGSKLLDYKDAVKYLKGLQPELIGGDMESAGMASACVRDCVDWIMVKGICDWGFYKQNDKDAQQALAAKNAAHIVVKMIANWN